MKESILKTVFAFLLVTLMSSAHADTNSIFRRFAGYTIVDVLTIVGWEDDDGKTDTSFNGCNFGRTIIFEGNKALKCASYGYQYAYRPDAVILVKNGNYKMIVDGDVYDMRNVQ